MSKSDVSTLKRGLKRMAVSLLTAAFFALSVYAFYLTAISYGYWAVLCFIAALVLWGLALFLLYVQGLIGGKYKKSEDESK